MFFYIDTASCGLRTNNYLVLDVLWLPFFSLHFRQRFFILRLVTCPSSSETCCCFTGCSSRLSQDSCRIRTNNTHTRKNAYSPFYVLIYGLVDMKGECIIFLLPKTVRTDTDLLVCFCYQSKWF